MGRFPEKASLVQVVQDVLDILHNQITKQQYCNYYLAGP